MSNRIRSFYLADERRSIQPFALGHGTTVESFRALPIAERERLAQREILAKRWASDLVLDNEAGESRMNEDPDSVVNFYKSASLPFDINSSEDWDEDDAEKALEWLDDHGATATAETLSERLKGGNMDGGIWFNEETGDSFDDICSEIAEEIRDHDEPQEIYQWFVVDSFLASDLEAIGEPVIDGELWGRTCCGQAVEIDGTLQQCADLFLRRHNSPQSDTWRRSVILRTEAGNFAAFPEAFASVTEWEVGAEWADDYTLRSVLQESDIAAQRLRLLAEFNRQNVTI